MTLRKVERQHDDDTKWANLGRAGPDREVRNSGRYQGGSTLAVSDQGIDRGH
jgi:hypothetical protein